MPNDVQQRLVVISISSRQVGAVAALMRDDRGEQVLAHRRIHCRWMELGDHGRQQAIQEVLDDIRESTDIVPLSVFVSMSDETLAANFAHGHTELGHVMNMTREERDLAFMRATTQAIGTNRRDLHALQPQWFVRDEEGDHEVLRPEGCRGSRLRCTVFLVTADRENYDYMDQLLGNMGIGLEGMIAPPIALYRGVEKDLPKRGSTIIIDCGARYTSLMVHRKGRLVHLESNRFGGDDLTEAIADNLKIPPARAEDLKRQVDISTHTAPKDGPRHEGQLYLWSEVEQNSRDLGPTAMTCTSLLRKFFRDRYQYLKDNDALSQHGRIHLFGRAAALGGLSGIVREIFGMDTVLGSKQAHRDPASELSDTILVGLVRAAADERRRQIALRRASSGFHQVVSVAGGLWSWLTAAMR